MVGVAFTIIFFNPTKTLSWKSPFLNAYRGTQDYKTTFFKERYVHLTTYKYKVEAQTPIRCGIWPFHMRQDPNERNTAHISK